MNSVNLMAFLREAEAVPGHGQDRVSAFRRHRDLIVHLAGGAGGVAGGAATAEFICEKSLKGDPATALSYLDATIHQLASGGKTGKLMKVLLSAESDSIFKNMPADEPPASSYGLASAAIATITDDGEITGASVGDCKVWIFENGKPPEEPTMLQSHRPLLGEGNAIHTRFNGRLTQGVLVMATDGLWKYADWDRITKILRTLPAEKVADFLVASARLPTGELQDDIAVAVVVKT